jgi:hypothetical protein
MIDFWSRKGEEEEGRERERYGTGTVRRVRLPTVNLGASPLLSQAYLPSSTVRSFFRQYIPELYIHDPLIPK